MLSQLKTSERIAATEARDPQVAAELERTSVAEQLALWLIGYRAEHGLSQTALARLVGMQQPAIARLEAATTSRRWRRWRACPGRSMSRSPWLSHRNQSCSGQLDA